LEDGELRDQVRVLLLERKKIEAIKLVRDHAGWRLKGSKEYVDEVQRAMQSFGPGDR
jgi:ribosomal protein L7/L12